MVTILDSTEQQDDAIGEINIQQTQTMDSQKS